MIRKMSKLIETAAIIPDTGLDAISADEQTKKTIREAMTSDAKDKIVKSYIEGMKKRVNVKINTQLL